MAPLAEHRTGARFLSRHNVPEPHSGVVSSRTKSARQLRNRLGRPFVARLLIFRPHGCQRVTRGDGPASVTNLPPRGLGEPFVAGLFLAGPFGDGGYTDFGQVPLGGGEIFR
jgi:hypothetical protein